MRGIEYGQWVWSGDAFLSFFSSFSFSFFGGGKVVVLHWES